MTILPSDAPATGGTPTARRARTRVAVTAVAAVASVAVVLAGSGDATAAGAGTGIAALRINRTSTTTATKIASTTVSATTAASAGRPGPEVLLRSAPASSPGGVTRFLLEIDGLAEDRPLLTITTDGLTAPATVQFTTYPAIGVVAADVTVPLSMRPGTYPFAFLAARGGAETRVLATLQVLPPTTATFSFVPKTDGATPRPSGPSSVELRATTTRLPVVGGGSVYVDVQVVPNGATSPEPLDLSLAVPGGWKVRWWVIGTNMVRVQLDVPASAATGSTSLVLRSPDTAVQVPLRLDVLVL